MSVDAFHCRQRIKALEDLQRRANTERRSVGDTLKRIARIFTDTFVAVFAKSYLNRFQELFEGLLASGGGPIGLLIGACLRMTSTFVNISEIMREANRLGDSVSDRIKDCEKVVATATAETERVREPLIVARAAVDEAQVLAQQADKAGMG